MVVGVSDILVTNAIREAVAASGLNTRKWEASSSHQSKARLKTSGGAIE